MHYLMNQEIIEKILTYTDVSFKLVYTNNVKEFTMKSNFTDIIMLLNLPFDSISPNVYLNFIKKFRQEIQNGFSSIFNSFIDTKTFTLEKNEIIEHYSLIISPIIRHSFNSDDNIDELVHVLNYLYLKGLDLQKYIPKSPSVIKLWNYNHQVSEHIKHKTKNDIVKLYDSYDDINFSSADQFIKSVNNNTIFSKDDQIQKVAKLKKNFIIPKHKFDQKLLEYTKSTLDLVKNWSNVVFCGEGLFNILNEYSYKNQDVINQGDIDLFFFGDLEKQKQSCYDIVQNAIKVYECNVQIMKYINYKYILELHIKYKPVIQLILTKYDKWEHIIHNFDFDYVKVVYDGKDVYSTLSCMYTYKHWIYPFTMSHNPRFVKRIYKTLEKGMRVANNIFNYEYDKVRSETIEPEKEIIHNETNDMILEIRKHFDVVYSTNLSLTHVFTGYEDFGQDKKEGSQTDSDEDFGMDSDKCIINCFELNCLIDKLHLLKKQITRLKTDSIAKIINICSVDCTKISLSQPKKIFCGPTYQKLLLDSKPLILEINLDQLQKFVTYNFDQTRDDAIKLMLENDEVIGIFSKIDEFIQKRIEIDKNNRRFVPGEYHGMMPGMNMFLQIEHLLKKNIYHGLYLKLRFRKDTKITGGNGKSILYKNMNNDKRLEFLNSLNNYNVKIGIEIIVCRDFCFANVVELVLGNDLIQFFILQ